MFIYYIILHTTHTYIYIYMHINMSQYIHIEMQETDGFPKGFSLASRRSTAKPESGWCCCAQRTNQVLNVGWSFDLVVGRFREWQLLRTELYGRMICVSRPIPKESEKRSFLKAVPNLTFIHAVDCNQCLGLIRLKMLKPRVLHSEQAMFTRTLCWMLRTQSKPQFATGDKQ